MGMKTRREFLVIAGGTAGYLSSRVGWSAVRHSETAPYDMVAKIDRERILAAAKRYLTESR